MRAMSLAETPAGPAGMAFGVMLRAAFGIVFGRFGLFLKAAAVPFALALPITGFEIAAPAIANIVGSEPFDELIASGLLLLASMAMLFPFAVFGVVLTRLYLEGPAAGLMPRPFPGGRVWRYFGYSLLLAIAFLLATGLAAFLVTVGSEAPMVDGAWVLLAIAIILLITFYLLLRLSLVFPAVSMDDDLRLRGSWRLTKRGSLKLFAVCLPLLLVQLLAMAACAALFGQSSETVIVSEVVAGEEGLRDGESFALMARGAPQALWNTVVGFFFFAMMTGALASAFAQLSGWGAPRRDILERFE